MFKCDIYESTFTRERDMRHHKKTVHEKSTGVCCNKCNKTFTRADNLKAHQKVCSKYFFFNLFDIEINYFYQTKKSSIYNKIFNLKLILFLLDTVTNPGKFIRNSG